MNDVAPQGNAPAWHQRPGFWNIRLVNPARTLILCAIGAFAGLGIAGYGLFTATGTTTAIYPAEDAAIVNGVPVLMVDLVSQVRALYDIPFDKATKAQRTKALDDMIREELYVQRGVELGMAADDVDVRTALVGAAEGQTASEALVTVPKPSDLVDFYNAHREKYSSEGVMTIDDWVLADGVTADAQQIAMQLRAGSAARSLGLVPSGRLDNQEQYYFAARIHLGDGLFRVASGLKDGAVSDPVRAGEQLHILAMQRNRPPVAAPYRTVQAQVLSDYTDMVKKTALAQNTKFLFSRAQISIAPSLR